MAKKTMLGKIFWRKLCWEIYTQEECIQLLSPDSSKQRRALRILLRMLHMHPHWEMCGDVCLPPSWEWLGKIWDYWPLWWQAKKRKKQILYLQWLTLSKCLPKFCGKKNAITPSVGEMYEIRQSAWSHLGFCPQALSER